jgi:hypothetical protein
MPPLRSPVLRARWFVRSLANRRPLHPGAPCVRKSSGAPRAPPAHALPLQLQTLQTGSHFAVCWDANQSANATGGRRSFHADADGVPVAAPSFAARPAGLATAATATIGGVVAENASVVRPIVGAQVTVAGVDAVVTGRSYVVTDVPTGRGHFGTIKGWAPTWLSMRYLRIEETHTVWKTGRARQRPEGRVPQREPCGVPAPVRVLRPGPARARRRSRSGAPNGIRIRAAGLKGRCPRPLDDGGTRVCRRGSIHGRERGGPRKGPAPFPSPARRRAALRRRARPAGGRLRDARARPRARAPCPALRRAA